MPIDTDAILAGIAAGITNPQEVEGDAGRVQMHPLSEQLEALRQVKAEQAAAAGRTGLVFNRLRMGGTL